MKWIHRTFLSALSLILLQGCTPKTIWYKGNTHAHTIICGHADSPPSVVTQWYHDRGYNFLVLSEHNHFINPDSVLMPENLRDDFILIPGEEVSGPKIVHSTALNVEHLVTSDKALVEKSKIIQNHVDITTEAHGKSILNHPNYKYAVSASDILEVKGLYMFELYNGHPYVDNEGDSTHISTEAMWDELLTAGMVVYGVSSDDAHHFETIDSKHSNPGRGWVMVQAPELSGDAIAQAMNTGSFYASNGVLLEKCSVSRDNYEVVVEDSQTILALKDPELRGKLETGRALGYTIEFIGPEGVVLSTSSNSAANYPLSKAPAYVRARVSYTRNHPQRGNETFFAWGQPVFTDGRLETK